MIKEDHNVYSHENKNTYNTLALREIAHARSGDKGNHANIGVIAYTEAGYRFLEQELTAAKVEQYFVGLDMESAERFSLPLIFSFNFLLRKALSGGASDSLKTDTQGKALATALLEMTFPKPEHFLEMLPLH